mgnify:CR=1 FL=1
MKKIIALCAALLMAAYLPAAYGASDVEVLPLTAVDDMQPAENPQASLEYLYNGESVRISQLGKTDLDAIMQVILGDGLVYDTERSEQLPADRPKASSEQPPTPNQGRLYFVDTSPNVQWTISFDETGALIERVWINDKPPYVSTFHHGFFTYNNGDTYQALSDICQMLAKAEREGQSQLKENQQWVYDFEILYRASMPTGIEASVKDTLNWGICSYRHTPSGGPVTRVFVNYPGEENFCYLITDTLHDDNTVQIDGTTAMIFGREWREYAQQEFLENWTLQLSINQQMEVTGVNITMMRNDTGETFRSAVDMSQYQVHTPAGSSALPQTEQFPFAPNWTEPEKPAQSQPPQEDQTDPLPAEESAAEQGPSQEEQPAPQPDDETQQPDGEPQAGQPEQPADGNQQAEDKPQQAGQPDAEPQTTAAANFSDVPQGHWAYAAITRLAENGIILGYGDGTFGTGDPLTYQQFALLLQRQFGYDGASTLPEAAMREPVFVSLAKALNLDVSNIDTSIIEQTFSDCQMLQPDSRPYIAAAIQHGLIQGADGKLFAYNSLTRAEAAVLLDRSISLFSAMQ